MRCIVQWLQKPDGSGNCPCCRAEPGEKERLVADSDTSSDSDSESDFEGDDADAVSVATITGITPLIEAAIDDDLVEVKRLIAEGVNLEEKDSEGDTALYCAVISDNEDCAAALIAAGADITVLTKLVTDAEAKDEPRDIMSVVLMAACDCNSMSVATTALARGADPNYRSTTGITPLMEAVRSNCGKELVDLLLSKGANVRSLDSDGWNVFMWFAESSCDIDIMATLLAAAGPAMAPRVEYAVAAKKIQAMWRVWKACNACKIVRRRVTSWFMDRMTTVV